MVSGAQFLVPEHPGETGSDHEAGTLTGEGGCTHLFSACSEIGQGDLG
jgi:hypothetical protein